MIKRVFAAVLALSACPPAAIAQNPADPAAAFGRCESIRSIALSPDGRMLAYVEPSAGQGAILYTVDLAGGNVARAAARADGIAQRLGGCDFVAARRLVCQIFMVGRVGQDLNLHTVSRLVALDADGSNMQLLGERDTAFQHYQRIFGGRIIDYLPTTDGQVLMLQQFVPDERTWNRDGRRTD